MDEISTPERVQPGSARRVQRMLRECKASAAPALLLAAACLALIGLLVWAAILG
jgi:hypothetical protein